MYVSRNKDPKLKFQTYLILKDRQRLIIPVLIYVTGFVR